MALAIYEWGDHSTRQGSWSDAEWARYEPWLRQVLRRPEMEAIWTGAFRQLAAAGLQGACGYMQVGYNDAFAFRRHLADDTPRWRAARALARLLAATGVVPAPPA